MNKLRFVYTPTDEISKLAEILKLGRDAVSELHDRYTLATIDGYPDTHYCIIYDLLYYDIITYPNPGIVEQYDRLCQEFGSDLVNMLVYEEGGDIVNKIVNILSFTIDKVYKSEYLVVEIEENYKPYDDYNGSIPEMIFTAIIDNYDVVKNCHWDDMLTNHRIHEITIKRRSKEND